MFNVSGDCNRSSMLYIGPDLEANEVRHIESLKFFNDQILNSFDAMLLIMLANHDFEEINNFKINNQFKLITIFTRHTMLISTN